MDKHQNFVGGKWVDAVDGATQPIINPATEETIAEVPRGSEKDVDRAVDAAARDRDPGHGARLACRGLDKKSHSLPGGGSAAGSAEAAR